MLALITDLGPGFLTMDPCTPIEAPPWSGPSLEVSLSINTNPAASGVFCCVLSYSTVIAFSFIPIPADSLTHNYAISLDATGDCQFLRDGLLVQSLGGLPTDVSFKLLIAGYHGTADNVKATKP
jgi:hypothetical protein